MPVSRSVSSGSPSEPHLATLAELQTLFSEVSILDKAALEGLIASLRLSVDHVAKSRPPPAGDASHHDALFRIFYKALDTANELDGQIVPYFNTQSVHSSLRPTVLHGILFTDYHKKLPFGRLQELCQNCAELLEKLSAVHSLTVLRCLNLFYAKYLDARIEFSLTRFYYCLQSQSSAVRDECVSFFRNWLRSERNSKEIFQVITNYWPWTNKYKFILLGAILLDHQLTNLLNTSEEIEVFLQGTRLALSHKNLFSAGQVLIKALSKQNVDAFDSLLVQIMTTGSHKELIYLNSQWMHYVQNKADLFVTLHLDQPLETILQQDFVQNDNFRLVMLCTMFERQFYKHPENDAISDHLQQNCFNFDLDTQLNVYKFLVGNMIVTNKKAPERLQFVRDFLRQHFHVPCSEFRNTILSKLPLVVDYMAKKMKTIGSTLISEFFLDLKDFFRQGLVRTEYQSLIINLKLFDTLLRCFASNSHKSLMKNSNVTMHQSLASMLVEQDLWRLPDEYDAIFSLLSSSGDFDDVLELAVKILIQLTPKDADREFELWKQFAGNADIDKCNQSLYFARLCAQRNCNDRNFVEKLFKYSTERIAQNIVQLEKDSLLACRQGYHIFGFFAALNELFKIKSCPKSAANWAISAAVNAVNFVLRQLNLAGGDEMNASFQIMEESLEMIVSDSEWPSDVHAVDRKFLLLSYWMTLKACCELMTSVGLALVEKAEEDEEIRDLLKTCLNTHATILHGCRHKGAIEAAGVSLGSLVKGISRTFNQNSQTYKLLYGCFDFLFGSVNQISTTRRGAGLSIMFHHFIKNDAIKSRPLFEHAIKILLEHAQKSRSPSHNPIESDGCHDNFDALVLHYLCVLVRDSELKDCIAEYYDEIMMSAIVRINDKEWAVRNGALQLFGALVPKIVGQKQSSSTEDNDNSTTWQPTEITFTEFCIKLPKTNNYILTYCQASNQCRKSTASIILFLEFLSNIDYIRKETVENSLAQLYDYRELFWRFLAHHCEKVRKLSSKCLARFHNFNTELPDLMLSSIDLIFTGCNENFIHGLILFHIHGVEKMQLESQYTCGQSWNDFCVMYRERIADAYRANEFSSYVRIYLVKLVRLVELSFKDHLVRKMLGLNQVKCDERNDRDLDVRFANFGEFALEEVLREIEFTESN